MCLCLSASLSPELHVRSSVNFLSCYVTWLSHPIAALRYVMHFRFYGSRHISHNEPYGGMSIPLQAAASDVIASSCTG